MENDIFMLPILVVLLREQAPQVGSVPVARVPPADLLALQLICRADWLRLPSRPVLRAGKEKEDGEAEHRNLS